MNTTCQGNVFIRLLLHVAAFFIFYPVCVHAELTPPTIVSVSPADSATSVPTNTTVNVVFDQEMDPNTITNNTFTILTKVVAISAGEGHYVALREDGTVVAWGANGSGQANVPIGLSDVVAIAAGGSSTVALKSDGTVINWGYNGNGMLDVPTGLSRVVAITAGGAHTVALKSDGTVVAWGDNSYGQTTVPTGLSEVVAIAAGGSYTVALKSDGTVVAWGASNANLKLTSKQGLC